MDDIVSDRTATVRIGACFSEHWDVDAGIGQCTVLSRSFKRLVVFDILINGRATALKRVCAGVALDLTAMPREPSCFCTLMIWSSWVTTPSIYKEH